MHYDLTKEYGKLRQFFNMESLHEQRKAYWRRIEDDMKAVSDKCLLGTKVDELASSLLSKHKISLPIFDWNGVKELAPDSNTKKAWHRKWRKQWLINRKGDSNNRLVEIRIPYQGDGFYLLWAPSLSYERWPVGRLYEKEMRVYIEVNEATYNCLVKKSEALFDNSDNQLHIYEYELNLIKECLSSIVSDLSFDISKSLEKITTTLSERKTKLVADWRLQKKKGNKGLPKLVDDVSKKKELKGGAKKKKTIGDAGSERRCDQLSISEIKDAIADGLHYLKTDNDETVYISEEQYSQLIKDKRKYKLFIDGKGLISILRHGDRPNKRIITPTDANIMADYIRSKKRLAPNDTKTCKGKSEETSKHRFYTARNKCDIKLGKREYLLFKMERRFRGSALYYFSPPRNFRYCVVTTLSDELQKKSQ